MPVTPIAFLIIYSVGIALALLKDPSYGVITYIFEYYHHPPLRWWGKYLPNLRWSFIIALVTLISYLLRSGNYTHSFFKAKPTKWLLLLLITVWSVTKFSAILPEDSLNNTIQYGKLVILYFLIMKTIRTKRQYQLFIWMHILGAFHWGWRAFEDPGLLHGRNALGIGGPDSDETNYIASHLLTVIPFLGYYFLESKNKLERIACILIAPFVVNMIIIVRSRGAFLALIVGGIAAIFFSRGVVKLKTILALILGAGLMLYLADDEFINRQRTIFSYEEDSSATSRLEFWKAALRMIPDNPFGLGGEGFKPMLSQYSSIQAGRAIHNTFLQVAVEWGVLGLLFYLAAFGSVFLMLHRIRKQYAYNSDMSRVYHEALAIEIALISRFAAAFFGAEMYHESFYWLAGLTVALYNGAFTYEDVPETEQKQSSFWIKDILIQRIVQHQIRKARKSEGVK